MLNVLQDLPGSVTVTEVAAAASVNATGNSATLDLQGFVGRVLLIVETFNTAGSSPTLGLKVQDSADNSAFADLTGGGLTGATTGASFQTLSIDTRAARRYLQITRTIGGTSSPAYVFHAVVIGVKQSTP